MSEGSPLKVHTERQATMLRGYLGERVKLPLVVDYAMRYGTPSIAGPAARAEGAAVRPHPAACRSIPQYSASTTATALDAAFALPRGHAQPAGAADACGAFTTIPATSPRSRRACATTG